MKHTPTPWRWKQTRGNNYFEHTILTDHQIIAELNGEVAENVKANAEHIVRACNCHEELVEACQNFFTWHANHFEDFDDETNKELLCLSNQIEPLLLKLGN